MTGAELLVQCLEREGVRYVFGIPGEETLDINEALARSSIRFVPVRHEQAAAFMADVWGRLTGNAGVCLATLGPGATNLATGLADANLDRAPVVAITGQLARHLLHKESHQYVDIVDVFRPFTKWNARIETGAVVAEAVRKAFKRAQEEKPGACHLELPEDVAQEPAEGEPLVADRARRPSPDRPSLARAADIINRAERPLVLAGNGVIRGRASKELRSLAERAQIPVVTTFMAKGAISAEHPLARTTVGLASDDTARVGFTNAPGGIRRASSVSSTSTSRRPRSTRVTSRRLRSWPTCARPSSSSRRSWRSARSDSRRAARSTTRVASATSFPSCPSASSRISSPL